MEHTFLPGLADFLLHAQCLPTHVRIVLTNVTELGRGLVRPLCQRVGIGRDVEDSLERVVANNVREDVDLRTTSSRNS
jgi:hypothetical protein